MIHFKQRGEIAATWYAIDKLNVRQYREVCEASVRYDEVKMARIMSNWHIEREMRLAQQWERQKILELASARFGVVKEK